MSDWNEKRRIFHENLSYEEMGYERTWKMVNGDISKESASKEKNEGNDGETTTCWQAPQGSKQQTYPRKYNESEIRAY